MKVVEWYSKLPAIISYHTAQLGKIPAVRSPVPATFEFTRVGNERRRIRTPRPCQPANLRTCHTISVLPGYSKELKQSGLKMGVVCALSGYSLRSRYMAVTGPPAFGTIWGVWELGSWRDLVNQCMI